MHTRELKVYLLLIFQRITEIKITYSPHYVKAVIKIHNLYFITLFCKTSMHSIIKQCTVKYSYKLIEEKNNHIAKRKKNFNEKVARGGTGHNHWNRELRYYPSLGNVW